MPEDHERITELEARVAELESENVQLKSRLAVLEKFQEFAQPMVINADMLRKKMGAKDYFKTERRHSNPLVDLGEALDKIKPVEPNQEIGESGRTMGDDPGG